MTFKSGVLLVFVAFAGCAHSGHPRGSVALKHSDSEADVCLGSSEVKSGDRLGLYEHNCVSQGSGRQKRTSCTKTKVGEGEVIQVLNDHYSTMKVAPQVEFEEGTLVEKL